MPNEGYAGAAHGGVYHGSGYDGARRAYGDQ